MSEENLADQSDNNVSDGDAGTGADDNQQAGTALGGQTPEGDATQQGDGGEGSTADAADNKQDESNDAVVPEAYEFNNLPEGFELSAEQVEKATPLFKELNLTQAQADKVANMHAEIVQETADAIYQQMAESAMSERDQWATDLKADSEIGGDKLDENVAIAFGAIQQFGSPELIELMNATGLGNHPELVKFAFKVGKLVKEDQPGNGSASNDAPIENRMYPNQAKTA